jgi:hypothetical protein
MRALKPSLAGTVILALLGGLGGVALAQDEADGPVTVTKVTGEAVSDRAVTWGTWTAVDGGGQSRGDIFEHEVEWSDPRLPSLMRLHENVNDYFVDEADAAHVWVGSIRLEGESGAWTGAEYGLGDSSPAGVTIEPRMMLLTGEGDYEGLSAVLQRQRHVVTSTDPSRPVFEGYIFEGDLPPMPEPLEPPAE